PPPALFPYPPLFRSDLARWADLAILAPGTANTINRLAAGLADDSVGTLFLAWELQKKPWWIAPAMNTQMFNHPITRASLQTLAGDRKSTRLNSSHVK